MKTPSIKYPLLFLSFVILFVGTSFSFYEGESKVNDAPEESISIVSSEEVLFESLAIDDLSFEAFQLAYVGYNKLLKQGKVSKKGILSIVDFSKPSNVERLFIIDIDQKKLIEKSYVAHGRNSGNLNANSFSNIPQSYQSSLGFYLTAETYFGKHGYSLRLDGMEKNINDKARERAIVIHGADYVSQSFIKKYGRLGRSFGCPSLPQEKSKSIIDTIKNKSCLFIYAPSESYAQQSNLVQPVFASK